MTLPDVIDWLAMQTVKPSMSPFCEPKHAYTEGTAPCCKLSTIPYVSYVLMAGNNGQPCCWAWKSDKLALISMEELPEQARTNTKWYTSTWYLHADPLRIANWYLSEGWGSREVPV